MQDEHNKANGIIPKTIVKRIVNTIEITKAAKKTEAEKKHYTSRELDHEIELLTGLMKRAAASLDFETAIELRNELTALQSMKRKGQ